MKRIQLLFVLVLGMNNLNSFAQSSEITSELKENVLLYNQKINELVVRHEGNGFVINKEARIPMKSGTSVVLNFAMMEGKWYHFVFVGDPGSKKLKANLYFEGQGDYVQDKIMVQRDNEFWTEFSFICPQTGMYELDLFQKSQIQKPLAYLMIFEKKSGGEVQNRN
ncbi:MAG: hypothetical protein IPI46_04655 [Bacteroidetes bacterium]|nr:hypothetical protein [Bacteroidota bacterium]